MFVIGLLAALVSSAMFNVGAALQALEARHAPKQLALRLSLLGLLLRKPRWLLGFALGLVGVAPQVLALAAAPFVVVQPALAVGLLLLLAIGARTLHEPVRASAWIGVIGIVAGVALVAAGVPTHVEQHRTWLPVLAVASALSLSGLLPFPVRGTRFDSAWLVVFACGTGFAATNVATKLMSDDLGAGAYVNALAWAVVAVAMGVAATLTGMTAFQRRPATMVVPVTTAIQTFLPLVLEPFFLRERWSSSPSDGLPVVAGLLVAAVGTVLVSHTRSVSELAAGRS